MDEEVVLVDELHGFRDAPRIVARGALRKVVGQEGFTYSSYAKRQDWLEKSIMGSEWKKGGTQLQNPKLSVHKVPQMLRDIKDFKEHYEPTVVSMGPYHNGVERLRPVEELKPKMSRQFLVTSDFSEGFFDKFAQMIEGVRECYDEEWTKKFDEEEFTQMMFLDGCFILYFINCILTYGIKNLGMKNSLIALVQQDMFLLENQLPFQVLEVLMSLSGSEGRISLDAFVDLHTNGLFTWTKFEQIQEIKPLHLLDLLRKKLLGRAGRRNEKHDPIDQQLQKAQIKGHLFRNVKELRATGIHLRPNTTGYLRDVNFRSYGIYGTLTLPRMTIDSSTRSMFLNLIAYEVCLDKPDEFGITSYLCFLYILIDHADDVKELRTAGILDNFLGSDEEVVKVFHEIADHLVPDFDTYRDVKLRIQDYFRHRGKIRMALWLAEVLRDHFKSPWTVIAVLAGITAICLSVVQTYFTIHPPSDKCNESICNYLRNKTL